jgi:hypothetical protein
MSPRPPFLDGKSLHRRRPPSRSPHLAHLQPRIPQRHRLHISPLGEDPHERVAKALGDAYVEPAKDVEGDIAYVKGQKKWTSTDSA